MKTKLTLARGLYWIINALWHFLLTSSIVGYLVFFIALFVSASFRSDVWNFIPSVGHNSLGDITGIISIDTAKRMLNFKLSVEFFLISLPITLAILYQLRKLFKHLVAGNYFPLENVKGIKTISCLMVLKGSLMILYSFTMVYFFPGNMMTHSVLTSLTVLFVVILSRNIPVFLFGFLLFILAQIFQEGFNLKQDQELTV